MKFDGKEREADYVAYHARERHERHAHPRLVLGEAKSFGSRELIKADDLAKLKAIGEKLPGSMIVISVMRDHFTAAEKQLLATFVKWARRPDDLGRPSHLVVLLTGNELFADFSLERTWKKLGGAHAKYANYEHTHKLDGLADATQAVYLGLPTFSSERRAVWEKKHAMQKAKATGGTTAEAKGGKKP